VNSITATAGGNDSESRYSPGYLPVVARRLDGGRLPFAASSGRAWSHELPCDQPDHALRICPVLRDGIATATNEQRAAG